MIQLHYLEGSSEITPFGNESGGTFGSEDGPAPSDQDTRPWDMVAVPTPGEAVDGEIWVPSIPCSLHSIPKLEGIGIPSLQD